MRRRNLSRRDEVKATLGQMHQFEGCEQQVHEKALWFLLPQKEHISKTTQLLETLVLASLASLAISSALA